MTIYRWLRHRPFLYLWLPLLAWMGLIFFLSAQPDLPHPEVHWVGLLVSSAGHIVVFGVLAILWMRVLWGRPRAWLLALALTALYALSDEFHQAFVPGRHPDLLDLACDGLGMVLALGLWAWWRR
jgi:VanZ family protein